MDVEMLRAETPGCRERVHLNNAGAALLSERTLAAMTGHLKLEARLGGYEAAAASHEPIGAVYQSLATLLGGSADEIALFDNSTHAWNAAFYSLPLRAGDRILTGRDEYGSNVLAYLQVSQRTGAEVVVIDNDQSGQIDLDVLSGAIDDRTKLIGLTYVPTSGGLVNPAAQVGRIAHDAGVPYLLDATQAVGQFPVDVADLGCDLLTGTGRKFLRGPRGTGFLWVKSSMLKHLDPHVAEIRSATWDGDRGFTWVEGARRFETWENSYLNILGLGAAVDQALELGLDAIGERTQQLADLLRTGLEALPGVDTYDLGTRRCGIVTAAVAHLSAAEVADALGADGINVSTTVPEHNQFDTEVRGVHPLVRISPHYYNTETEIQRCIDTIARLDVTT